MRGPLLEIKNGRKAKRRYFPLVVMFLLMGGFAFLFYMNLLSKKDHGAGNAENSVEQLIIEEVENGKAKGVRQEEKGKGENFTFYKTLGKDPMKPRFDPGMELNIKESEVKRDVFEKEVERPKKEEALAVNSTFSVQVAAFADFNRADQMLRMLKTRGYDPFILAANSNGDEKRYRVRFGKFKTVLEAAEQSKKINLSGNVNSIVVKDQACLTK